MKMTVQKAYVLAGPVAKPALLNSRGQVFTPDLGWHQPEQVQPVAGETYDRWEDVPAGWLGGVTSW